MITPQHIVEEEEEPVSVKITPKKRGKRPIETTQSDSISTSNKSTKRARLAEEDPSKDSLSVLLTEELSQSYPRAIKSKKCSEETCDRVPQPPVHAKTFRKIGRCHKCAE